MRDSMHHKVDALLLSEGTNTDDKVVPLQVTVDEDRSVDAEITDLRVYVVGAEQTFAAKKRINQDRRKRSRCDKFAASLNSAGTSGEMIDEDAFDGPQ